MESGKQTDSRLFTMPEVTPLVLGHQSIVGDHPIWNRFDPAAPAHLVGQAATTDEVGARMALAIAETARREWSNLDASDRLEALRSAFTSLTDHGDILATIITAEVGKTAKEARLEVNLFLGSVDWFAREIDALESVHMSDATGTVRTLRHARGTVVLVLPWNWPLFQLAAKLVPALLAGNVVVVKPSPLAPHAVSYALRQLAQWLPEGVIGTVLGPVETTVKALLADTRVDFVSFTGSVETGRRVMRIASEGPTPVVLELGGNDPALLLKDVELDDRSVVSLMQSMFTTTGQGCQLIKRLIVHHSRAEELIERLESGIRQYYVLGHGSDPTTTMGPLVSQEQRSRVERLLAAAVSRGGQAHVLASIPSNEPCAHGWFLAPTIVTGLSQDADLVREEQFGPVVPILTFDDEREAVALANAVNHGLGSSIWSRDEDRALELAKQIEAGATYINNHNAFAIFRDHAVGGRKVSGIGREWGREGLIEYAAEQVISNRKR